MEAIDPALDMMREIAIKGHWTFSFTLVHHVLTSLFNCMSEIALAVAGQRGYMSLPPVDTYSVSRPVMLALVGEGYRLQFRVFKNRTTLPTERPVALAFPDPSHRNSTFPRSRCR